MTLFPSLIFEISAERERENAPPSLCYRRIRSHTHIPFVRASALSLLRGAFRIYRLRKDGTFYRCVYISIYIYI